jgi:hypothetical protein
MRGRDYRVVGELTNADIVTDRTFWIGLYPGLTADHLQFVTETINNFIHNNQQNRGLLGTARPDVKDGVTDEREVAPD